MGERHQGLCALALREKLPVKALTAPIPISHFPIHLARSSIWVGMMMPEFAGEARSARRIVLRLLFRLRDDIGNGGREAAAHGLNAVGDALVARFFTSCAITRTSALSPETVTVSASIFPPSNSRILSIRAS